MAATAAVLAAPSREALVAASHDVVRERFEGVAKRRGRKGLQLGTGLVPEGLGVAILLVDAAGIPYDANDLGIVGILQRRLFQDSLEPAVDAGIMAGEHQR